MKPVYITLAVLLLLALTAAAMAQAPGGNQGGGRPGGDRGRFGFGMGMGMGMGVPAMAFNEGFLYIVLGNVLYKIDVNQMQMVGWVWLQPPTLGAGAPGAPQ